MSIIELKENILQNNIDDKVLVFKYKDTDFVACEYAERIASNRNLKINYIESLSELSYEDGLFDEEVVLSIYKCDKLVTNNIDLSKLKNLIIICKSVSDSVECIEFPKLESWQVIDYAKHICEGLDSNIIEWLCSIMNNDVYRIKSELDKINIFAKEMREDIFNSLNKSGAYSELSTNTVYELTTSLLTRDIKRTKTLTEELLNMNVEPLQFVALLSNNLKKIINIQLNKNSSPQSIGVSLPVFNKMKSLYLRRFSDADLIKVYELVLEFSYRMRAGLLDISKERQFDYLINNILFVV